MKTSIGKKALSAALLLVLATGFSSAVAWADEPAAENPGDDVATLEEAVDYLYPVYRVTDNGALYDQVVSGVKEWRTGSCSSYNAVSSEDTTWGSLSGDTWYVASGDVTINNTVTVVGNVNLILADNANLTVNGSTTAGICVSGEANSLTVYAQSVGDNMGHLTATGKAGAGIGSADKGHNAYNITINGGYVVATGSENGAGIGGAESESAYYITVNGGNVKAVGGWNGACIGGGYNGGCYYVVFNGGSVDATADFRSKILNNPVSYVLPDAAGIGGGAGTSGNCGDITVNGGNVKTWGNIAIGSGKNANYSAYTTITASVSEKIYVKSTIVAETVELAHTATVDVVNDIKDQNYVEFSPRAAGIGETYYDSLSDAFAAAQSGDVITLLNDNAEEYADTSIILPEGFALDLNGYSLTAKYFASFGGTVKDGSAKHEGALLIEKANFMPASITGATGPYWLPVYESAAGCYRFYGVQAIKSKMSTESDSATVKIQLTLVGQADEDYLNADKRASMSALWQKIFAEDGGQGLQVDFTYTSKTGDGQGRVKAVFLQSVLQKYVDTWANGNANSVPTFTVKFTNVKTSEPVTETPLMVSSAANAYTVTTATKTVPAE